MENATHCTVAQARGMTRCVSRFGRAARGFKGIAPAESGACEDRRIEYARRGMLCDDNQITPYSTNQKSLGRSIAVVTWRIRARRRRDLPLTKSPANAPTNRRT